MKLPTLRPSRLVSTTAMVAIAVAASLLTTTPAVATELTNTTPEAARTFTTLPFVDNDLLLYTDRSARTDPVSSAIATACNSGNTIYAAYWWKFAPTAAMTFTAQTAQDYHNLIEPYAPIGTAVVAGDLSQVLSCGQSVDNRTRTPAHTVLPGSSVYLVTYELTEPDDGHGPALAAIPTTGEPPVNDLYDNPTPIGSVPFTTSVDTSLATFDDTERQLFFCEFTKWRPGPAVWFSWTAPRTDTVQVSNDGSSYYASVAWATLADGVPTPFACNDARRVDVQAGTTYLIGLYGEPTTLPYTGQLQVDVRYMPPAPDLTLTVSSGTVNKKTGVVTLKGQVTCQGATSTTNQVEGSLQQTVKRNVHTALYRTTTGYSCTGGPVPWTATVQPTTFLFTGGAAVVTGSVTACNVRGCSTATTTTSLKLKVA